MFYNGLGRFLAQDGGPGRPKIAPRRVQDRLGSVFLTLDFSLRFLIVLGIDFGAVLASQMAPGERMDSWQIGTWAVQDGPKIVLVRSFFRLVVRDRFFGRLGLLLGSFLVVLGSS